MALEVTQENFDGLIASNGPVVVDFGADWCGPCKTMAPIMEQLAQEYKDKAVIATCDVEECNGITERFSIRNVPTILFFKNGEQVDKLVGAQSKATLAEHIEKFM